MAGRFSNVSTMALMATAPGGASSAESVSLGRLRRVVQYRKGLVPVTNEHETQILHQR
jgi:hypothetical protein